MASAVAAQDPIRIETGTEIARVVIEVVAATTSATTTTAIRDRDELLKARFIVVTQDCSESEGDASEGIEGGELHHGLG